MSHHQQISRDLAPMLAKVTFKGPFAENRAQIGLYLLHSSRPWQLIIVWELPEVTTVSVRQKHSELYETKIFEKKYSLEVD